MTYESLLLECGGGICKDFVKDIKNDIPTLCIGIGGLGMEALVNLKKEMYRWLKPGDASQTAPGFPDVQFLAIDSDDSDYRKYASQGWLREEEFFSLADPAQALALCACQQIKNDPRFSWMDMDAISKNPPLTGTGGLRQVGRYLLINKAVALFDELTKKAEAALIHGSSRRLDIYIFAGLSGGTGGGCFLDVCYLLRAMETYGGIHSAIMGYFFTPDVITEDPRVAGNYPLVSVLRSNGYAAMKELDYLMTQGAFSQNYGVNLHVSSDAPPVDVVSLISGVTVADMDCPADRDRAVDVAVTDALECFRKLSDFENWGMQARLSWRYFRARSVRHGAAYCYRVPGNVRLEPPYTQNLTYLGSAFMERLQGIWQTKHRPVYDDLKELQLTGDDIYARITRDLPALELPDIPLETLEKVCPLPAGSCCQAWATPGNLWRDKNDALMEANLQKLRSEAGKVDDASLTQDSCLGRVYHRFRELCGDTAYGPYCAARRLESLCRELDWEAKSQRQAQQRNKDLIPGANAAQAKQSNLFAQTPDQETYEAYKDSVLHSFRIFENFARHGRTAAALEFLHEQVQKLYADWFLPLCQVLDNLSETGRENSRYLKQSAGQSMGQRYLPLYCPEDEQKRLDELAAKQNDGKTAREFLDYLWQNSSVWRSGDETGISALYGDYIKARFPQVLEDAVENYLAGGPRDHGPSWETTDDQRQRLDKAVRPMFLLRPYINDFLPQWESGVQQFALLPRECSVSADSLLAFPRGYRNAFRVPGKDRVVLMEEMHCIPMFAYGHLEKLKQSYDALAGSVFGRSAHLYSGTGENDWRSDLPAPAPYSAMPSLVPEKAAVFGLYEAAEAAGIIVPDEKGESCDVLQSPEQEMTFPTLEDFLLGGQLHRSNLDDEIARLRALRADLHKGDNCRKLSLVCKYMGNANPGKRKAVYQDCLALSPRLQKQVRRELAKQQALDDAIESLLAAAAQYREYEQDLEVYCDLIFRGNILCTNVLGVPDCEHIARISFTYRNGDRETCEQVLCERNQMPYAELFPLYQGFLTFRGLDESLRRRLKARVEDMRTQPRTYEDAFLCAQLDCLWDQAAVERLEKGVARFMSEKERRGLIRFYDGLRNQIYNMRREFPRWPSREELKQKCLDGVSYPVLDGSDSLILYPARSRNCAWSQEKNTWVPLNPRMYIQNAAKQWEHICLDLAGNFILE